MNIFLYSTHLFYTPHIETELELMQLHLNKGDNVFRFICNGELSICDMNQKHDLLVCLKCQSVRKCGEKLLEGNITNLPIIKNIAITSSNQVNDCKTISDIIKIYYKNFDIGYAIMSSMISICRNSDFNISDNKVAINEYYKSSLLVYLSAIDYVNTHKPDKVYIFNGRLAHTRAVLRACEATNTHYVIHERGADKDHYELFNNTIPHSIKHWHEQQEDYWKNNLHSLEEKKAIGAEFFLIRKNGEPKEWVSFTKDQDPELLPENFDRNKKNIVLFNSSMDEFAAVSEEWVYPFFDTQEEFISNLLNRFGNEVDYHFYLRIHPHLKGLNNSQMDRILQLKYSNLTIIAADSKVSSYHLLDNCDQVITFASTMGIEAAYWNKPSILVAPSLYNDSSMYRANNYEEVVCFIKTDLPAKNNLGALQYGYYNTIKGETFNYFKADSLFTGTFKGVNVMDANSTFSRLIKKLYNIKFIGKPIAMYDALYKKYKLKLLF